MTGWGEWVRYVVAPAVFVLVTAWIATRNARKTPHERLKNLVDTAKNMPEGVDPDGIVVGAIARELVDFDRRLRADQSTLRARWTERFIQNRLRVQSALSLAFSIGALLVFVRFEDSTGWPSEVIVPLLFGVLAGTNIIGRLLFRVSDDERHEEQKTAQEEAVQAYNEARADDARALADWSGGPQPEMDPELMAELQALVAKMSSEGADIRAIARAQRDRIRQWRVQQIRVRNAAAHGAASPDPPAPPA